MCLCVCVCARTFLLFPRIDRALRRRGAAAAAKVCAGARGPLSIVSLFAGARCAYIYGNAQLAPAGQLRWPLD